MIDRFRALLLWGLLGSPGLAIAHGHPNGSNNFYNGLMHSLFVPSHLLLLIAVGFLFGQQGAKRIQPAFLMFSVLTMVGLVVAWFSVGWDLENFLLTGAVVISLTVAAGQTVGLYLLLIVGAFSGFFVGVDSAHVTLSANAKLTSLLGSGIGMFLLVAYPILIADFFRKRAWQKIGIRVIGSWIAASSIMVLALTFRVSSKV